MLVTFVVKHRCHSASFSRQGVALVSFHSLSLKLPIQGALYGYINYENFSVVLPLSQQQLDHQCPDAGVILVTSPLVLPVSNVLSACNSSSCANA